MTRATVAPVVPSAPASVPMLIRDARLVDGRGVVLRRGDLRISGGRIREIAAGLVARPGEREWQAGGRTVVPGLMNAHVHVAMDGGADPAAGLLHGRGSAAILDAARARLPATLRAGVTTIRDLGAPDGLAIRLAREVASGTTIGPRIVAAGRPICVPGGHGNSFMSVEVTGTAEAGDAARAQLAAGAQVIKVMATGGMMTPDQVAGEPQLSSDEMRAVVDVAAAAGIPVAAHSEGIVGTLAAIGAGVSSIEHGHGLDQRAIEAMLSHDVALVPTLLSDEVILRDGVAAGIPAFVVEACKRLADSLLPGFEAAVRQGVRIVAGNDGGAPLVHPGDLVSELELYVRYGMRPQAALHAATAAAASLFDLADVGRIEEGAVADLLVVDGDPLTDIGALRGPRMVVFGGAVVHEA
jgi:imidazolonepropionase-like amidohydrolase